MARAGPILILCILLGTLSSNYGSISLLNAQCRAKCYTEFHIPYENITRNELCLESSNCSSCVIPCSGTYKSQELCRLRCESASNQPVCHSTCDFLKLNRKSKKGECPSWDTLEGFEKACALTCSYDTECEDKRICCSNGCGMTCQEPIINKKYYPSKIRNPASVTENPDGSSAMIEWSMRKSVADNETVLYCVQGRNNTGHHPSKHHMGDWLDMDIVENMHYITPLGLGRYYSFRIAAVNQNGTLGFGKPTDPIRLSTDPSPPSPPLNLREGRAYIVGDRVNLVIMWDPPKNSDMELLRYKIFYSERRVAVSPFLFGIVEHKHNVPKDQHEYELTNLHQGMRYFIQVQAMVQWGSDRLRSERASIYIDTVENQPKDTPPGPSPWGDGHGMVDSTIPNLPRDVAPEDPFWENEVLKTTIRWNKPKGQEENVNRFTIHWRPESCLQDQQNTILEASTHDTFFTIYNLRFECQYMVIVVAVSDSMQTSPAATIHFYTPQCEDVVIIGDQRPICPTPVPDLPSLPVNVSYEFILFEQNITARFRWKPPSSSLHQITGYNIIWAEPRPDPPDVHVFGQSFPILDLETRHSKRLNQNQLTYNLSPLKSGTRYIVQLWATSSIGGGAMYTQDIRTPKVKIIPQGPDFERSWTNDPKKDKTESETLSPAPHRTGDQGYIDSGGGGSGNCACHQTNHLPIITLLSAALLTITVIALCR